MTQLEQPTPAFSAAQARRRELRVALVALEDAVSAAARSGAEWRAQVGARLADLAAAFERHVADTEGPGGLYQEMETLAPHVSEKARRLREEHPDLAQAIAAARAQVAAAGRPDVDEERAALERLMVRLVRHRQRGADLVWDAYLIDIGGSD